VTSACGRCSAVRSRSPSGRAISGLDEMRLMRWSPPRTIPRRSSWKSVSEGEWPGRCRTRRVRSRRSSVAPAGSGRRGPGAPPAERPADRAQGVADVLRDPVAGHDRVRERVVGLHVRAVRRQPRREAVERRDLGAGAPREDVDEPDVVHVLVGDHDQLEVLDAPAERGERLLELVERLARVRPGVDQRQRLVVDEVAVDAPDRERRRDGQAVDARVGGEGRQLHGATNPRRPRRARPCRTRTGGRPWGSARDTRGTRGCARRPAARCGRAGAAR
jgi:hypothetical protein